MDLQNTFYVIGIIFMVLMVLLFMALLVAVFVIKAKINHMHQMIHSRVETVKNVTQKAGTLLRVVKHFAKL